MGSQKAVHLSVLTSHRRARWEAAVQCAEGWEAAALREIGGVSDGPGGYYRKGQSKVSKFRNLGEIQFFIHENFSWVRPLVSRQSLGLGELCQIGVSQVQASLASPLCSFLSPPFVPPPYSDSAAQVEWASSSIQLPIVL